MLLNYNFNENLINSETSQLSDSRQTIGKPRQQGKSEINFHLVSDKIKIPQSSGNLPRKRLNSLLETFSARFCGTFINGRAGTGKTTLASEFAKSFQNVAWIKVSSTDADWKIFSRYFLASLNKTLPELIDTDFSMFINDDGKQNVQKFVESLICEVEKICLGDSLLIVFDDLHNVFDSHWFEAFFKELLGFNFPNISILFLSRIQPPFPIWRLRSKQRLGYLDEKLLLFTKTELKEIIKQNGLKKVQAEQIHKKSFGRISKIIELAGLVKNSLF